MASRVEHDAARKSEFAQEVARRGPWYHTFDLPQGVVTDGYFDLRSIPSRIPIPSSLAGKRCLDAAACEGFWSFELARRGADEVVSIDLPDTSQQDWQAGVDDQVMQSGTGLATQHFEFIREALRTSNVERIDLNVYDISPDTVDPVDYVFVGNILIHLADPARALRALRSVLRPGGELLSLEPTSLVLSALSPRLPLAQLWDRDDQPRWWTPNIAAHRRLLQAAGFEVLAHGGPLFQPFGTALPAWPKRLPRTFRELLFWTTVRRIGAASYWVRARPSGTSE